MDYFPLIMLFFFAVALITRPLTVFFHELGHALPAIIMTRQPVTIYIGSYGDPKKSLRFRLGMLDIWFKYNPFLWRLGLMVPSAKEISINKQIIYTLAGPITSIIIALIARHYIFGYDMHGFLKLWLVIFFGSAILDLIVNLTPEKTPIKLYDGRVTYNDGYTLILLFYYKRLPKEYLQAAELYDAQQYKEAAKLFRSMLEKGVKKDDFYRLAISAFCQVQEYQESKPICDEFLLTGKLNSDDYTNIGITYAGIGLHDQAMAFYGSSLSLNPNNKHSLNNKGYLLNQLNRFEEAIPYFNRVIEIDPNYAYAFNNRGHARIKTGEISNGLADINHSLTLNVNNAYSYRNLGIYHLDQKDYTRALELFYKAKELDNNTELINDLILEAERNLPVK